MIGIVERNRKLPVEFFNGEKIPVLAKRYKITRERAKQIIKKFCIKNNVLYPFK
jgi:Mor family transcriptional regulator